MFGIILERFIHVIQSASTSSSNSSPNATNSNSRVGGGADDHRPSSSNNNDTNESLLQAIASKQSVIAENLKELSLVSGTKSTPQSGNKPTKDGRYGFTPSVLQNNNLGGTWSETTHLHP